MDYKTYQQKIKHYKEELLALKCPQGITRSVDTYYYELNPPTGVDAGTYTIYYTDDSPLPPITIIQGHGQAYEYWLGHYDASTNTQKLFVLYNQTLIYFMSTREITIIEQDE